jgi:hypothetical protein
VIVPSTSDLFTVGKSDGADVRFTSADGKTLLDFEREVHDDTNSIAVYHVKVPLVSSTSNTEIYLYYGNASATDASSPASVWDSDYVLVMHMDGSLEDSTSNNNDGTNYGSTLGLASDGYYRSLRDSNYFKINSVVLPSGTKDATVEAYISIHANISAGWNRLVDVQDGSNGSLLTLYWDVDDYLYGAYIGTTALTNTGGGPSLDTYKLWSSRIDYSNTRKSFLLDGVEQQYASETMTLDDSHVGVGCRYDNGGDNVELDISELRISSCARSDAWIKATSESLSGSLITFEEHESVADWLAKQSHMLAFNF